MLIDEVIIRKILDSRGNPTVEVEIYNVDGGVGRAAAPSGASTGKHEVMAFPAGGVDSAVEFFEENVAPQLTGHLSTDQRGIDALLKEVDGTENFSRLGGNVAVATSLAVAKAAASSLSLPLYMYIGGTFARTIPRPEGNIIGGGKHAAGGTTIQEFLCVAEGETVWDSIRANAMVHRRVGEKASERFPDIPLGMGDERAWNLPLEDEEALALLKEAIDEVSDELGVRLSPAIDFAASSFHSNGKYVYRDRTLTREEQMDFVVELVEKYDVLIVEDPLHEEDFEGFAELVERIGDRAYIVGDDLFVTNPSRIMRGAEIGAANAVLIKPNQVGTLTGTWEAVMAAKSHGYATIISHRSGETEDETIAHLGVAFGCEYIKTGTVGGERLAKLNELIRIEEEVG